MDCTCGVDAAEDDVDPVVASIRHGEHSDADTYYTIEINFFATISITKISKNRCTGHFDSDIKDNNKSISKILNLFFPFDIVLQLEEPRL